MYYAEGEEYPWYIRWYHFYFNTKNSKKFGIFLAFSLFCYIVLICSCCYAACCKKNSSGEDSDDLGNSNKIEPKNY